MVGFFVLTGCLGWATRQSFHAGYRAGYTRGDLDATLRRVDRELIQAEAEREAEERYKDSAIDNPPLSR